MSSPSASTAYIIRMLPRNRKYCGSRCGSTNPAASRSISGARRASEGEPYTSHLLGGDAAGEQSLRADQKHDHDDEERRERDRARGHEDTDQVLDHAEQDPAGDAARQAGEPADDRSSE